MVNDRDGALEVFQYVDLMSGASVLRRHERERRGLRSCEGPASMGCPQHWNSRRGESMPLFRGSIGIPLVAALMAAGGCAGPEDPAAEKATWSGQLGSRLKSGMQAIQDVAPDLPRVSRIVYGSERCHVTAEGETDCGRAALNICRAQGYEAGRAIDTASVNACRPRSIEQIQTGDGPSCRTKYQVTAALCW